MLGLVSAGQAFYGQQRLVHIFLGANTTNRCEHPALRRYDECRAFGKSVIDFGTARILA